MDSKISPSNLPWNRKVLYGLTNWALFFAGMANLLVGTWAAIHESTSIAATSLTAGLVLLFAATIDRFESLKGLGIEAKTRQLDTKLSEADEALRRLREMTEITGAALIRLNSKIGRWGSAPSPRESIAFADGIRQIMKGQGSDDKAIAVVLRPWARTLCFDMARVLSSDLRNLLKARIQSLEAERQKIPQPLKPDDPLFLSLNAKIKLIADFQTSRINNFHKFELDEFPDKFMAIFEDVPLAEPSEIEPLRKAAARYAPGMVSLRETLTLSDPELWIEALEKEGNN